MSYKHVTVSILAVLFILFAVTGCGDSELQKARDYISVKMFDEAIALLKLKIQQEPTNAEAHCLLGEAFLSKGDVNSAKEEFSRTISLEKDMSNAIAQIYFRIAEEQQLSKNFTLLLYCVGQAITYDTKLILSGAQLLTGAGLSITRESPAISHQLLMKASDLDSTLLTDPDFAFSCLVSTELNVDTKARNAEKLLTQFPGHTNIDELLTIVADSKFDHADFKEAKKYYERILPFSPQSSHAYDRLHSIMNPKVIARIFNADDLVSLYVNDDLSFAIQYGSGTSYGAGKSDWVDITSQLHSGTNVLRFKVWNNSGCCSVSGSLRVMLNDILLVSLDFDRKDSQEGYKYDEAVSFTLP